VLRQFLFKLDLGPQKRLDLLDADLVNQFAHMQLVAELAFFKINHGGSDGLVSPYLLLQPARSPIDYLDAQHPVVREVNARVYDLIHLWVERVQLGFGARYLIGANMHD